MHFMVTWGTPILMQAFALWLVVCVVVLPVAAIFYRRMQGTIPVRPMLVLPLLLLYLVGIISFTFLPLPDPHAFQCDNGMHYPRFFPGWSVEFALRHTAGMGLIRFGTWLFVQIYLNVLLFVPWGILAWTVFKLSFRTTVLTAFAATLLIELTQLTGIWGIYPCSYRTFDVDDMITNTLGAILGWLLVHILVKKRLFSAS